MSFLNFFKGFAVTGKQPLKPKVTVQYPEEKRAMPERRHGRHVLNRYEDGMEKCIGCELCAGVCPARCIYVRGADNPPDAPVSPGERYGFVYEINFLRCIHCDMCVEACPTEAITESKMFEFSFSNREDSIYTKAELLVDDEGRPKMLPWEDWRQDEDRNTSAWARATAPSGRADLEGRPLWSGELGYGVRPAQAGQSDPEAADVPADFDLSVREADAGAAGVVVLRNTVHCALMLVLTLFGVALLFIEESADFLAAVQIIVYAGAIVILFLFVIMLLGVDRSEARWSGGLRLLAPVGALMGFGIIIEMVVLSGVTHWATGAKSVAGALNGPGEDVQKLGQIVFTRYLLPFESTSALLLVAVVGAVVLARRAGRTAGEMTPHQQRQVRERPLARPPATGRPEPALVRDGGGAGPVAPGGEEGATR